MSEKPPVTPLNPDQLIAQEAKAAHEGFLHRDAVAIDDCAGEVLFGAPAGETISTEAAIMSVEDHGVKREVGEVVSGFLDVFQHNHGGKAAGADLERAQAEVAIIEKSGIA